MQLTTFSTFLTLLLPLTTVATPIPTPNADLAQAATDISYDSSPAALAKRTLDERKYKTSYLCDIVNVVTEVDCWAFPQHGGKGNEKVTSYKGTKNDIEFSCYVDCEDVYGNT
ncbi:hypothetical protein FQN55_003728 [Onygenales sp. PD_40]|nr:hypothetical protein FQN55_003728 [Onygenales sp. PD_40]